MTRWPSRIIATALLAAGATIAAPAIAGQLIVRSSGPSAKQYPPGKQIPDNAKIELRPGDSVTLLAPGSTRTFRGPGMFNANGGGDSAVAANRRARFGALRSGDLNLNPNPWNVDVAQGGRVCVPDPAKLKLWRPNTEDKIEVNISGGGKSAKLDWSAGESTVPWPAQLPVEDGAEYQLEISGTGEIKTVTLTTMPGIPGEMMDTAQALIERGCETQLDTLVAGIDQGKR